MSETPYNKREIDILFENKDKQYATGLKSICDRLDSMTEYQLKPIVTHLEKLNSKTEKINDKADRTAGWKKWMNGGMTVFFPVLIFVGAWFYRAITVEIPAAIKDSIEARVDAELDGYKLVSEPPVRATFINATIASTTHE